MRAARRLATACLALLGLAAPAVADEAKTPLRAALILDIMSQPSESREAAFDMSLREDAPPPRATAMEVLPDGTVRYGDVTVTVKNPCPPGTAHYEPPPLPGRRARK